MNILITGCFAPGTTGTVYGIRSSSLFKESKIFGIDQRIITTYIPEFEHISELKSDLENSYVDSLCEYIVRMGIDVVIPQTTRETILISRNLDRILKFAKVVNAGTYDVLQIANDKLELFNVAKSIEITSGEAIPYYQRDAGLKMLENAKADEKNLFFKSKNLSGGRGVIKVIPTKNPLSFFNTKPSSYHLASNDFIANIWNSQINDFENYFLTPEYLGYEYSVDVFIGENESLAIPRKRLQIRNGISQINFIENNDRLIASSLLLAKTLGLNGLVGFQFIIDHDGDIFLLECNPRIQGTNYASILAGSNLIEFAIALALGIEVQINQPKWNSIFMRNSNGILIEQ